ncbi:sensor histidine kinase [Variovorax terrae]|uniref:histidine kinase n=1 Tax=Variovorax terrae TaxID=2923278 RepID=A0A9X2APG7_9BURK|nr:ATP-binding protein [Variovorax terrae]MCJ0762021.1 ATP-binding protein [Variovorax terrae]
MASPTDAPSWFGPPLPEDSPTPVEDSAFARLWRGFMTARIMIAVVLLLMQGSIYGLGQPVNVWLVALCSTYLAATLAVRLLAQPRTPGRTFDTQWVSTIGVDLIAFSALQFLQGANINYTPLFALPVLLGSVMGSLPLALGTAAGVTLVLLVDAWWISLQIQGDAAPRFLQSGLTGIGLFIVAFLANQLALRLAREEALARRSQHAARVQTQVNELVIETLADGVLVVDINGVVRAANPAARRLLGSAQGAVRNAPFVLAAEAAWQALVELARLTFVQHGSQISDIAISHAGQNPRRIHVRTRLTATHDTQAENLCVMFLQDLREMEARLRTEKLAAMGRMSAAVAHEIRNPLAAISQANALLDEDLTEPAQKQLTMLVRQNALRLAQIVEEVLDISRVQQQTAVAGPGLLDLDANVATICADWSRQTGAAARLSVALDAMGPRAVFDAGHLRRVLINLLDNALRYAGQQPDSIQVSTVVSSLGECSLLVWSDGEPLEQTVQRHLFEPFFSSESRSSGLGLYICRELCERHGALIGYQRAPRGPVAAAVEGNEFFVTFRAGPAQGDSPLSFDTILV